MGDSSMRVEAALWPAWTEKVLLTEARTRPIRRGTTVAGSRGEHAGDGDERLVLRGGGVDASWNSEPAPASPARALLCSNLLIATHFCTDIL